MKRTIATLTVIAAAALGAQGQTYAATNTFPVGTGTNSFSGLTFSNSAFDPDIGDSTKAQLLFTVSGVDFGGGNILFKDITLTGQGITTSLSFDDVMVTANSTFDFTAYVNLNAPVAVWNAASNTTSFTAEFRNGASALYGAQIGYRVRYATDLGENLSRPGDVNLIAVPEPSTYVAAAGLLGLFLWSARRHLFKLAGSHSASSCDSANGAA